MKKVFITLVILFFLTAILIFRPVPIVEEKHALVVSGEVIQIYESGVKDISFILKDVPTVFYINRGLEKGLKIGKLRDQLMHQEVTIKYPHYWTPLDWNDRIKHLSKLEHQGEVIFNELK
jgi:hypothetical protein